MLKSVITSMICLALLAEIGGADVHDYIIYPMKGLSAKKFDQLRDLIRSNSPEPPRVYESTLPDQKVPTFWVAPLNTAGYLRINGDKAVCDMFQT